MLVSDSVNVDPSFAVPASLLSDDESLTRRVPSTRQNTRASSFSTRLHSGQRFIVWSAAAWRRVSWKCRFLIISAELESTN